MHAVISYGMQDIQKIMLSKEATACVSAPWIW